MTAKEAAQKAKDGWKSLAPRLLAGALWLGIGGYGLSKLFPELLAWLKDPATLLALLGFAEKAIKRTGGEVTNQFFERLGQHDAKIAQGEKDHDACHAMHDEHRLANARQDKQLGEIAGEAVKAGWKLGLGS